MILSGRWLGKDLASAYNNRGIAYSGLKDYRRAIQDYDQPSRRPDKVRGVAAIGHVRGIRDIDEILSGQALPDLRQHRNAAETGIDDANWSLRVHG